MDPESRRRMTSNTTLICILPCSTAGRKGRFAMPNFLHLLATHNNERGIVATHSEMKKTARRLEKLHAADIAAGIEREADAYILGYSDDTGEIACGFKVSPFPSANDVAAARRLRVAA